MCLAIPMKLLEISGVGSGVVDVDGAKCEVDISLIENPNIGDYLVVHAGFAIEKLDTIEADARLELFKQMAKKQKLKNSEQ